MSYIEQSLGQGERLVARAHFHWWYSLKAWLALIFLGIFLIGIWIFVAMMVRKWTTEIGVTTHRFVEKEGLFTLRTFEVALNNIEGVRVSQSFWGRIMGYGNLRIEGTGVDHVDLPTIADPIAFRAAIESAKSGSNIAKPAADMRKAALALATVVLAAGAALAAPGLSVTGVDDKDTLNLHAAPDAKSPKTGALPPHESGIAVVAVDPRGVDWLKVRKGNISGWANARFLHYDQGMPVRMTCSGSEPGFVMEVGYGKAIFLYNEKPVTIALDDPKTPAVTYSPWLLAVHGKPGLFAVAAMPEDECHSDSDDETTHNPYSVVVNLGGVFTSGCCK